MATRKRRNPEPAPGTSGAVSTPSASTAQASALTPARRQTRVRRANGSAAAAAAATAAAQVAAERQAQAEEAEGSRRGRDGGQARRAGAAEIARNRAAHFAHYDAEADTPGAEGEEGADDEEEQEEERAEQWPGPFSTARQLQQGRARARQDRQEKLEAGAAEAEHTEWTPCGSAQNKVRCTVPKLLELTVGMLCDNIEAVVSLVGMPDAPREIISRILCERRLLSADVIKLFTEGFPAEVVLPDCARLDEGELQGALADCLGPNLELLYLGYCGRGMSDRTAQLTFGCKEGVVARLSSLTLHGCYRLSDAGLTSVLNGAPTLTSLSLTDNPRITPASLHTIAEVLAPTLQSLTLDGCHQVARPEMVAPLRSLLTLSSISLAFLSGVTDSVVSDLAAVWASGLTQVNLSETAVTDKAISNLATHCPNLRSLLIAATAALNATGTSISGSCLNELAKKTLKLQVLNLNQCIGLKKQSGLFSLLNGPVGPQLVELNLAQVPCVDNKLLMLISRRCHEAMTALDLSWCRSASENALGAMADALPQLKTITLFGCRQVTSRFLDGVQDDELKIVC